MTIVVPSLLVMVFQNNLCQQPSLYLVTQTIRPKFCIRKTSMAHSSAYRQGSKNRTFVNVFSPPGYFFAQFLRSTFCFCKYTKKADTMKRHRIWDTQRCVYAIAQMLWIRQVAKCALRRLKWRKAPNLLGLLESPKLLSLVCLKMFLKRIMGVERSA